MIAPLGGLLRAEGRLGVFFTPKKGRCFRRGLDPGRDTHASGGEFCTPIKKSAGVQRRNSPQVHALRVRGERLEGLFSPHKRAVFPTWSSREDYHIPGVTRTVGAHRDFPRSTCARGSFCSEWMLPQAHPSDRVIAGRRG